MDAITGLVGLILQEVVLAMVTSFTASLLLIFLRQKNTYNLQRMSVHNFIVLHIFINTCGTPGPFLASLDTVQLIP